MPTLAPCFPSSQPRPRQHDAASTYSLVSWSLDRTTMIRTLALRVYLIADRYSPPALPKLRLQDLEPLRLGV